MNPDSDPLAGLKDVILPPDPSFWPPAVGWWLLVLVSILFLIAVYFLAQKLSALLQRKSIVRNMSNLRLLDSTEAVIELSILLRQVALTKFPRSEVAGLTGTKWLEFLDQSGGTNQFTKGVGKILETAPYSKRGVEDLSPVFDLCEDWVRKVMMER